MSILILDNYDSFTYNLVHFVEQLTDEKVEVHRNDKITLEEVNRFDKIILSPGPGIPSEANLLKPIIQKYHKTKKMLGVCLGHQAITEVFGGSLINTDKVYHGIATNMDILTEDALYKGMPKTIAVGRYHSWISKEADLPEELEITARAVTGEIMSIRHKKYDVSGVQYHPESVLTPQGLTIIDNWLKS